LPAIKEEKKTEFNIAFADDTNLNHYSNNNNNIDKGITTKFNRESKITKTHLSQKEVLLANESFPVGYLDKKFEEEEIKQLIENRTDNHNLEEVFTNTNNSKCN